MGDIYKHKLRSFVAFVAPWHIVCVLTRCARLKYRSNQIMVRKTESRDIIEILFDTAQNATPTTMLLYTILPQWYQSRLLHMRRHASTLYKWD